MATLTPTPPAPAKDLPPDDRDLGPGEPAGPPAFSPPKKRRSVWPFLTDFGLVMALFGLIIAGRPLIAIGAVIFVAALIGWVREARAEFSGLAE